MSDKYVLTVKRDDTDKFPFLRCLVSPAELQKALEAFPPMSGMTLPRWTREPPTKPGRYRTADRFGHEAGILTVVMFGGEPAVYSANEFKTPASSWAAWWWSEPIPDLPKPPEWYTERK